jgi:hypothetical protein
MITVTCRWKMIGSSSLKRKKNNFAH